MKAVRVASLLRRGMYKEAEKEAHRKHISYFDFCELVKRFYHGTLTEEDLSVQASDFHMCEPKATLEDGDYYCVEVYTQGIEVKELEETYYEVSPYIYGYVPVEFMETLCLLHGGIK